MKLSTLQETLAALDVRPSKRLGQNFLHDQNLAAAIVSELALDASDTLVEIGPGLGALTEYALPLCQRAILLEKDRRLADYLRTHYASEKVEVVNGDAVDFDVRTLFEYAPVKLLGNLPYNITSPVLFQFGEPSPVGRMVFTIQREFAERLTAQPSTKDYGALTVILHRRWRARYLRTVPGSVFLPRPNVDSAVISLVPREPGELPNCDGAIFDSLVKAGFSQRRKQVRKLLAPFGVDWPAFATRAGIPETARAEELSPLQWIDLANTVRPCDSAKAQNVHAERFDVVDANDRVLSTATRHEVHTHGLLHRAVHIFVFNRAGDLFLQKRSRWKDVHPSTWDSSAAGHVDSGYEYAETAVREMREELGITGKLTLLATIPACEATGHEFVHLYKAESEGPFVLAPSEIECGGFFPVPLIRRWVQNRPQDFATGFIECFARHYK